MYLKTSISIKAVLIAVLITATACVRNTDAGGSAVKEDKQPSKSKKPSQEVEKEAFKLSFKNATTFLKEYGEEHNSDEVLIHTDMGDIGIRLYRNTPLHRASFLYLCEQDYFDGTWFYRVSEGHVIQAGNTDGRKTQQKRDAIGEYMIPPELDNRNYHKKGAVAAARPYKGNPDKYSDPYEFYISLGRQYNRGQLLRLAKKHEISFTEDQLNFYSQTPGSPHLDGEHTVFGEVISGMEVVEKISKVKVDAGEWPMRDIPITVEVVN